MRTNLELAQKSPRLPIHGIASLSLLFCILFGCGDAQTKAGNKDLPLDGHEKPTVSFTFDDGQTSDLGGLPFEVWNPMILAHLDSASLKAVFFVTGRNKQDEKGRLLLKSWNDQGHKIGNHTFTHPNFNSEANTAQVFKEEIVKTHGIIASLDNHIPLFRFPYLKEGGKAAKVDSLRNVLENNGYDNGYVTIDAFDWYVNQRLVRKIQTMGIENANLDAFQDFYVAHILDRARYYENLSRKITGRHIRHTLLLHHNLTSALFLGDLIRAFRQEGWELIDADLAFRDSIFQTPPNPEFAGESLIYSLAKQSGNYDLSLRYPAEDSRYEKGKMDSLGL